MVTIHKAFLMEFLERKHGELAFFKMGFSFVSQTLFRFRSFHFYATGGLERVGGRVSEMSREGG